jgi:hypothetical protein
MTEQERQKIKARLIEFGFWGSDEPGDPTTDVHDAGTLNDRLQERLTKGAYLISEITFDHSLDREVVIFHGHQIYKLVTAPDFIEAVLLAASALPEFLRQHPECAADDRETAAVKIGEYTEAPDSGAPGGLRSARARPG